MSTLIQFRVSGEDETEILAAAKHAGMRPADYVRHCARLASNRPDTVLQRIEERLAALEAKLPQPSQSVGVTANGPATLVKGLEITDLVLELRREQRAGINAFLRLLDGEPLPDIPHRRATPDQSDFLAG